MLDYQVCWIIESQIIAVLLWGTEPTLRYKLFEKPPLNLSTCLKDLKNPFCRKLNLAFMLDHLTSLSSWMLSLIIYCAVKVTTETNWEKEIDELVERA